jgi:hypothetical protein
MNVCSKLRNNRSNRVWNATDVLIVTMDTTLCLTMYTVNNFVFNSLYLEIKCEGRVQ